MQWFWRTLPSGSFVAAHDQISLEFGLVRLLLLFLFLLFEEVVGDQWSSLAIDLLIILLDNILGGDELGLAHQQVRFHF